MIPSPEIAIAAGTAIEVVGPYAPAQYVVAAIPAQRILIELRVVRQSADAAQQEVRTTPPGDDVAAATRADAIVAAIADQGVRSPGSDDVFDREQANVRVG